MTDAGDGARRPQDGDAPWPAGDPGSAWEPQDTTPPVRPWQPQADIPEVPRWTPRDTSSRGPITEEPRSGRPSASGATVSPPQERKRMSTGVKIGLTAAVAGVGLLVLMPDSDDRDQPTTHAGVCVDKDTNTRLPDSECEGSGGTHVHHGWYFIPFGYSAPRLGAPVSGGSFDAPRGTSYVTGGVDGRGGTVSSQSVHGGKTTTVRGGFGGSGKSNGG
ncbi:hypothetical protein MOPEL_067_00560 [Mobilicoccus pelagius NBRC 104925]|uniref:Uncharacterized protein n=2 Tax=Mobilicoccus TaxID=984996 RepID=H5UR49_9MICO|nr:hypothetical protein MOPEL_067_00560 [Mobilicoccus pelagius NBRC 104925]